MITWSHVMNCTSEAMVYFQRRNQHATYSQLAKFVNGYMRLYWPMARYDLHSEDAVAFRQAVRHNYYQARKK